MAKKSGSSSSKADKSKSALSSASKPAEDVIDPKEFAESEEEFEGFEDFESTDEDESSDETPANTNTKIDQEEKAKIGKIAKEKAITSTDTEKGVIYVGRIPHGLYEPQMREYFGQFGTITRIRISRNKRTGKSKHFGFIEFRSREVSKIVCEAMDNYLLFGHLLQVKMMEPSQVHEDLWEGANHKYHAVPWDLVNAQRSKRKHPREYWEQKQNEFDQEKQAKARRLQELGIIY